mmetsp:Transcript_6066/g.9163  ORF Transcript_6066/g.9163 Transcript_6066/m.9163 type:complete len:477 (+) Transcript_6066:92-1522(+)|eukprot:CAMPEP_0185024364 /NCGR_PEP_ID=MMETSP1103-20130426/7393_1 /TAXON_ID=36769 /ORGANISM="Paraphysomonas bandaiensis, Strain Caron Lab Isolate" /LENGTH=476 /DNA_ID=CAMNT_0027557307 /DNA_START=90 /DNA_END=1523 /DNA_ORIENTATION=+
MSKSGGSQAQGQRKGIFSGFLMKFAVGVALLAIALQLYGFHMPSLMAMAGVQLIQGIHGLYGFGLILHEPLSAVPISDYVPLGYMNSLKLKGIYCMRYWMKDNFLFENELAEIHKDILADFERRGVPKGADNVYEIPNFRMDEIDGLTFFNDYVKMGRPVILKSVLDIPAMSWTPDNLAERVGDFNTSTRCMDGTVRHWTLAEYVSSRSDPEHPCYLDNNANIFEKKPFLEDELELWRFSKHMSGIPATSRASMPRNYLFSQMFMSVFDTTGALFHCANYNNLFMMIHGRKKWTFVDPSNSFLMYPMMNGLFKDSKSFLTWMVMHGNNSDAIIDEHFPLYRYAPKYEYTLEPGDMLLNPPWNWHMVENLDKESIGIAQRWRMASVWPYTNALFSFLQFSSWEFSSFMYNRIATLQGARQFEYKPTAHQSPDHAVNFGKYGSVYEHRSLMRHVTPPAQWKEYVHSLIADGYITEETP